MNSLRTLLVICLLCIISCKKDKNSPATQPPPAPPSEKKAIKFQLAEFAQEVGDIENGKVTDSYQDSLRKYVSNLFYLAFDSTGQQVSAQYQLFSVPHFGQIIDSLLPGKYTIVMIGAYGMMYLNEKHYYDKWEPWPLSTARIKYGPPLAGTGAPFVNETYYKKTTITVSGDSTITGMRLDRIVGRLDVIIEDSAAFDQVPVHYYIESDAYLIGPDSLTRPRDWNGLRDWRIDMVKISQGRYRMYVANNKVPFSIFINGIRDASIVMKREVPGIRCYWNKITTVKGKLDPSAGGRNSAAGASMNGWSIDTNSM